MKVKTIILSTAVALLIAQCSQLPTQSTEPQSLQPQKNETSSFSNLSSDVLIDLPSCIAADPFAEKGLGKVADLSHPDGKIYDAIRTYVGYANEAVNNNQWGVVAMINFWRDTDSIDWGEVKDAYPDSVKGDMGEFAWTAWYTDDPIHWHLIVRRHDDCEPLPIVLRIEYNGYDKFPKGRVYYHLGRLGIFPGDSLEVLVNFNKEIGEGLSLDVGITGLEPEPDYDPEKIELSLYSDDGLIHMSGSSYHPNMGNILKGVTGHCYTFTGIVDPLANKSIINLGLPPASYGDTVELFTAYGFADVWTSAVIEQEILMYQDTMIKVLIASSYTHDVTVDEILNNLAKGDSSQLVPSGTIDAMTVEQFRRFLELNQSISFPDIRAKINEYLWLTQLDQSIYLNYLGYVGNGTSVPSGFNYLNNVSIVPDAKIPSETAGLVITP